MPTPNWYPCCCTDVGSLYVPCCLYGIEFHVKVRSDDLRARDDLVALRIFKEAGEVESANHAGTHFYGLAATDMVYGSMTWYHWGANPLLAQDLFIERSPTFEVDLRYRNSIAGTTLKSIVIIEEPQLKFKFQTGAGEQTVTIAPTAYFDPDGTWNGVLPGLSSNPIDNCDTTGILTLQFPALDPELVGLKVTKADEFIRVTGLDDPNVPCFEYLRNDDGPLNETVTVLPATDCTDTGCLPNCDCVTRRPGRTYICGCDPCYTSAPFQTGKLDNSDDFPNPDFYETHAALIESGDWTIWTFFAPHETDEGTLIWHGTKCYAEPNDATVFELYTLFGDLILDINHQTGFSTITVPAWTRVIDTYQFIAIRYNSSTREVTLNAEGGTHSVTLPSVIRSISSDRWTIFGNTGQEFQVGAPSIGTTLSIAGCWDAEDDVAAPVGVRVINGTRLDDSAIATIIAAGC